MQVKQLGGPLAALEPARDLAYVPPRHLVTRPARSGHPGYPLGVPRRAVPASAVRQPASSRQPRQRLNVPPERFTGSSQHPLRLPLPAELRSGYYPDTGLIRASPSLTWLQPHHRPSPRYRPSPQIISYAWQRRANDRAAHNRAERRFARNVDDYDRRLDELAAGGSNGSSTLVRRLMPGDVPGSATGSHGSSSGQVGAPNPSPPSNELIRPTATKASLTEACGVPYGYVSVGT